MNVLIFALDNIIFLLYPYRVQQEGLEIFLRTMLTFTGKGIIVIRKNSGKEISSKNFLPTNIITNPEMRRIKLRN